MENKITPIMCGKRGCSNKANYIVRLSLAVHANHAPAISDPIVYICKEHEKDVTWQSLNVDANWDMICNSFEAIGRVAPVKEFSKVIIEPLHESHHNSSIQE